MRDQKAEYERQAMEYEEKARRVSDPRVRERFLALAKNCREEIKRVLRPQASSHSP